MTTTQVCADAACTSTLTNVVAFDEFPANRNDFSIYSNQVQQVPHGVEVNTLGGYINRDIYLKMTTAGGKTATKQIKIKSCGYEQPQLSAGAKKSFKPLPQDFRDAGEFKMLQLSDTAIRSFFGTLTDTRCEMSFDAFLSRA